MSRSWNILPQKSDDLIKQLLFNRGIKGAKEIDKFFNPRLSDYEDDLKVLGLDKAVERIKKAIKSERLIMIYGDYDVDGVCGTAIAYLGLSAAGAKVIPYIPHRLKEGYGLSKQGLDYAKERGVSLVITVDNGIVAYEAASYAASLGLDLIITDHHQPQSKKPMAKALVWTTKLCGAAIAWCLIRELKEKEALSLLDLVGIATVADLMPLLGVNRCLAKLGLGELNRTERVGLLSLFEEGGIKRGEITPYHINFVIGPRLNAMGRLEHAIDSLRLLCTKNASSAQKLAKILSETNVRRQQQTVEVMIQAKEMTQMLPPKKDGRKFVFVHSPDWSAGIIGLVAGRLCEEYRLPVIVISEDQLYSKGSARSIGGVDIVEVIRQCSDLLIDVGGHHRAAGFTIETAKIELFKQKFREAMEEVKIDGEDQLEVEAVVNTREISLSLAQKLLDLEPTGMGNPKPVLASYGVRVSGARVVGGDGRHLKFLADGIEAIAFRKGEMIQALAKIDKADIAFNLEINKFNNHTIPQLKVVDIRF